MPNTRPYADDLDYLGDEARFLRIRTTRIETGKELRETNFTFETGGDVRTGAVSLQHRVTTLKQTEEDLRGVIEARRRVSSTGLGINRLCQEHDLRDEERLLVVAACIPALSTQLADEVFGGSIGFFGGGLSVEELARLLAPASPREWAEAMKLLGPKATLIANSILGVDYTPSDSAAAREWNGSQVYPSGKTLALVTGQDDSPVVMPGNGTQH